MHHQFKDTAIIPAILSAIYENRELLSQSKFSGVYKMDQVYRVHLDKIIPHVFRSTYDMSHEVQLVVDIVFHQTMEFDKSTLWLTIK